MNIQTPNPSLPVQGIARPLRSGVARHRWFNDWQGASGIPLRALVDEVAALLAQYEADIGARQRKRRPEDQVRYLAAVEGTVANLAYAALIPPETGRLAVLTGHSRKGFGRYDNPAYGKPFAGLLGALRELGLLSMHAPSSRRREAGTIEPTPLFADMVASAGIGVADFCRLPREELVTLKRKPPRDPGDAVGGPPGFVDYPETTDTRAMRASVERINTHLEGADITFVDDGLGPVDHLQRRLVRRFTLLAEEKAPHFGKCGRLYGGFWQNLKRARRAGIRINGEPVVDLDFASMFPRLAYATTGKEPPAGDLYAIEGLGPEYRSALKLAVNTFLFDTHNRRHTWPDPEDNEAPQLPAGWTVSRTRKAILKRHPALKSCFGTSLGYGLMRTESDILVSVLEEMRSRGIVGLGIHDGLLLPSSRAEEGKQIMETIGWEITGQRLPVASKPTTTAPPLSTIY